jgi:hypothetical protein
LVQAAAERGRHRRPSWPAQHHNVGVTTVWVFVVIFFALVMALFFFVSRR